MNIYCLTAILNVMHNAIAYIEITGELTFDVHPINANNENKARVRGNEMVIGSNIVPDDDDESGNDKTRTLRDIHKLTTEKGKESVIKEDCLYQYPNEKQIDALLSDMMNQLTKIFVRAHEYMGSQDVRRIGKRFKIMNKKFDSGFFEDAYNLMSKEFRQTINNTTDVTRFSNHDPCHHQSDIKQVWLKLLEDSRTILKRAAVRCVSDFLRVRHRADDTRTKEKLGQLLVHEIKEVRSNQLKALCDDFKLCYKDLL